MTAVTGHLLRVPLRRDSSARATVLMMTRRSVTNDAVASEAAKDAALNAPTCDARFAAFYDQHYRQLVVAFTSALGDRRLAEDAAQEAMLRACQRWNKIGEYDNPSGWCYRVGMNWATSRWRKRRREVSTDTPMSIDAAAVGEARPDQALLDAIHALPDEQREVVVLRVWMDWSVRETSVALDIPEGTVRSRQARGLKRLKEMLEGTEGYEDRGAATRSDEESDSTESDIEPNPDDDGVEAPGAIVNGAKVKRTRVNGSSVNGTEVNGTEVNGTEVNGTEVNGAEVNGAAVHATAIDGAEIGDAHVKAAEADGIVIIEDGVDEPAGKSAYAGIWATGDANE